MGWCTIYFLKEVFWEHVLFSKTGWLSKKFLWENRIRVNLSSSFTGIFFILLLTLRPYIAVTENIGLAKKFHKVLWKNPNFWPTQYISLKTLNLGSEAFLPLGSLCPLPFHQITRKNNWEDLLGLTQIYTFWHPCCSKLLTAEESFISP